MIRTGHVRSLKTGSYICSTHQQKPSKQQRFNWGFQDGKAAAERGNPFRPAGLLNPPDAKHPDYFYGRGYQAGYYSVKQ